MCPLQFHSNHTVHMTYQLVRKFEDLKFSVCRSGRILIVVFMSNPTILP